MHLIGVKEENGWAVSRWELTYPVGWENIKRAVAYAYGFYNDPEVLAGRSPVEVKKGEDVLAVPENANMTLRGWSVILKAPIMIVFYNQLQAVDVTVAQMNDEFKNTDYEKFNHSLCQYLDSMEIAMYRA